MITDGCNLLKCQDCIYSVRLLDKSIVCYYIVRCKRRRPCAADNNCTEFKAYSKNASTKREIRF